MDLDFPLELCICIFVINRSTEKNVMRILEILFKHTHSINIRNNVITISRYYVERCDVYFIKVLITYYHAKTCYYKEHWKVEGGRCIPFATARWETIELPKGTFFKMAGVSGRMWTEVKQFSSWQLCSTVTLTHW